MPSSSCGWDPDGVSHCRLMHSLWWSIYGGLSRLHFVDDDVVQWLANFGRWTLIWKKYSEYKLILAGLKKRPLKLYCSIVFMQERSIGCSAGVHSYIAGDERSCVSPACIGMCCIFYWLVVSVRTQLGNWMTCGQTNSWPVFHRLVYLPTAKGHAQSSYLVLTFCHIFNEYPRKNWALSIVKVRNQLELVKRPIEADRKLTATAEMFAVGRRTDCYYGMIYWLDCCGSRALNCWR